MANEEDGELVDVDGGAFSALDVEYSSELDDGAKDHELEGDSVLVELCSVDETLGLETDTSTIEDDTELGLDHWELDHWELDHRLDRELDNDEVEGVTIAGPDENVEPSSPVDTELNATLVSDQPPVLLLCRTDELLNTINHTQQL